ncbi:MAG: hypothetical protein R2798_10775 [Chitinophagales bacterium]|nr:hypothetical protein [Bacteroidota bacterium]
MSKTQQQVIVPQNDVSINSQWHFGRFYEVERNNRQKKKLQVAEEAFRQENYIQSIKAVLAYLQNKDLNNIKISRKQSSLSFKLFHGSQLIHGYLKEARTLVLETPIMQMPQMLVPVMRKLLEKNYKMQYANYALAGEKVLLRCEMQLSEMPPQKLLNALREIAVRADKDDDLLLLEFPQLRRIETNPLISLPPEIVNAKINTLKKWLSKTLQHLSSIDEVQFPEATAYCLLGLAYRIDYYLLPEAKILANIEEIHSLYYNGNLQNISSKNQKALQYFKEIQQSSEEKLQAEFYTVVNTFSLLNDEVDEQEIKNIIADELSQIPIYQANFPAMVNTVYEYIALYLLFYFALIPPLRKSLGILVDIYNASFFVENALPFSFMENNRLHAANIIAEIQAIIDENAAIYPNFSIDIQAINFTSSELFAGTLFKEILKTSWQKKES